MLVSKYPPTGTTIFSVMTALANEYGAINLSQGFPDFAIDKWLGECVAKAIKDGYNQYAPMAGLPYLCEAISRKIEHFQRVSVDPVTEITVTPGATYGIYTAFATILEPGDEVIVLEPAYDSYIPDIYALGAKPVCVSLNPISFTVDWGKVREAVGPRTKAIIINNPHNPTGVTWTAEDFDALTQLVETNDMYVVSDEVYEHLVYDGKEHCSVLRFPELRARSFVIHSFGKAFHSTGWKMGYCVAAPELMKAFRAIHQYLAFSVNTPMQQGIANYLSSGFEKINAATQLLQDKRDFFLKEMQPTKFKPLQAAAGSYFQLMDYSELSDLDDKAFAIWLTKEHGVATIPLSSFYRTDPGSKLVRFCFAKKESTLSAAVEKLRTI